MEGDDSKIVGEDPLIAALPPATDYITYLTLLEYQLTPQNLSTLNALLAEDDGTLAKEIGWDLLKLVLPMLRTVPEEAIRCLETVARRGNPREVVVRVAEELEKIGNDRNDFEQLEEADDVDELPTFVGEADRIHLGSMKLDGMPNIAESKQEVDEQPPLVDEKENNLEVPSEDEMLKMKTLLTMLSILHPRIKTKYPSRFLATSLPAALGAYRRLEAPASIAMSFLAFLGKLSGKQRPALPPRASSSFLSTPKDGDATTISVTAPLPDPEASNEATGDNQDTLNNEKAIITRLLQGVMLEVLDEYVSNLNVHETSCFVWTTRLREKYEPQRVLRGRTTESQRWEEAEDLKEREALMAKVKSLARDLELDSDGELTHLLSQIDEEGEFKPTDLDEDDVQSEYPTKPSQIPFPPTGIILLYALQHFKADTPSPTNLLSKLGPLLHSLHSPAGILSSNPITPLASMPTLALEDACLSLLYLATLRNSQPEESPLAPEPFIALVHDLQHVFTSNPHPQMRDNAHYIAAKLLHSYPDPTVRLTIIKQILKAAVNESDPATRGPVPAGTLKSVTVDWLKTEFLSYLQEQNTKSDSTRGLDPNILHEDNEVANLIFPSISPPPASNVADNPETNNDKADGLEHFLSDLPFHISVLNLCCVLLPRLSTFQQNTQTLLTALEPWHKLLLTLLASSEADVSDALADIGALDDAFTRALDAVDRVSS